MRFSSVTRVIVVAFWAGFLAAASGWGQRNHLAGRIGGGFAATVPPHGVVMIRVEK